MQLLALRFQLCIPSADSRRCAMGASRISPQLQQACLAAKIKGLTELNKTHAGNKATNKPIRITGQIALTLRRLTARPARLHAARQHLRTPASPMSSVCLTCRGRGTFEGELDEAVRVQAAVRPADARPRLSGRWRHWVE